MYIYVHEDSYEPPQRKKKDGRKPPPPPKKRINIRCGKCKITVRFSNQILIITSAGWWALLEYHVLQ
jgi:hypothetical protein